MKRFAALALLFLAEPSAASAQSADSYLQACTKSDSICEGAQLRFETSFPKALAGDHSAQRDVSSCLTNGCDDAVRRDRVLGCAWRLMITKSVAYAADLTDAGFFNANCTGSVTDMEVAQMKQQAGGLFRTIYQKPMPEAD